MTTGKYRDVVVGGVFVVMLAAIAFGAWTGFPVFDDAYLFLYSPELNQSSITAMSTNRPISGLLLKGLVDVFGVNRLPYVAINIAFWILLAWQTWRLSSFLFKGETGAAVLSAIVILSPILVKTQYTTITTLMPDNLPVSICFAVLIFSLRNDFEHRVIQLIFIGVLIFAAASISEYGVAAAGSSIAVLLIFQKRRTAFVVLLGAIFGYILARNIGDFRLTPGMAASFQYDNLIHEPFSIALRFCVSLWHSLIGSYGAAASKIHFDAESRSTIVAAFASAISMLMILKWFRHLTDDQKENDVRRPTIAIFLAVISGIIPVIIGDKSLAGNDSYETRFAIPILPFATIASVRGALYLTSSRFRPWIAAFLTFIAMYTVISGAWEKRNQQKAMEDLGRLMEPIVEQSYDITVVVVPNYEKLYSVDITPKVASKWPVQLVQRFWTLRESEALKHFGPRTKCSNPSWINEHWWSSTVSRRGPVSQLFFVPSFWTTREFSSESLEPYCIESAPLGSAFAR